MEISNQELLEISLKIERDGRIFYEELSKFIEDSTIKEFILVMAREEVQHEKQFKKMLEDKGGSAYGWENQSELRQLIDNRFQTDIFPNLDEIFQQLPKFQGIQKALEFAIETEKVSSEFYGLLRETCRDYEVKTLLILLEKAEHEHLQRVQALKEHYLKKTLR